MRHLLRRGEGLQFKGLAAGAARKRSAIAAALIHHKAGAYTAIAESASTREAIRWTT
jgi:hypothetical protein